MTELGARSWAVLLSPFRFSTTFQLREQHMKASNSARNILFLLLITLSQNTTSYTAWLELMMKIRYRGKIKPKSDSGLFIGMPSFKNSPSKTSAE